MNPVNTEFMKHFYFQKIPSTKKTVVADEFCHWFFAGQAFSLLILYPRPDKSLPEARLTQPKAAKIGTP